MNGLILRGDICYSLDKHTLVTLQDHYLVCIDGLVKGVFEEIPKEFCGLKLCDYSGQLIVPGMTDLHLHAPQYAFRGLGMDMELLDWLNARTFPEESKYADLEYAKKAYTLLVDAMTHSATTRACVFSTLHVPATLQLMEMLEKSGLKAYVGKVNMDRNSPEYLCEKSAEQSAEDTVQWIEACQGRFENVHPILTPRFIPTCSDDLMGRLKNIQRRYQLPVQSHLSENAGEIAWVQELCPESEFYGDAYDHFGLFGGDVPTIMAHCVHSSEAERARMKANNVFVAHCPQSNENLSSGVAPIGTYLDEDMNVGLGSDIAGGIHLSIFRAMADAIQVSKLRWRLVDDTRKPLTVEEAFFMGSKGGGAFFGKCGSFEEGYEADILVLDETKMPHPQELSVQERLERFIYLSDEGSIRHKYVAGKQLF